MAKKGKPIEIDILDMEMSEGLPHWLDPIELHKGKHDADRKQKRKERSDAIQAEARKKRGK